MIHYRYLLFSLLVLLNFGCNKQMHIAKIDNQSAKLNEVKDLEADAETLALIAPYQEQLEAKMNQVVGSAPIDLSKKKPESPLGNWVADLIQVQCQSYTKSKVDFAVVNYGGLRIPTIPAGQVTRGKLFELMPFDNLLVVVEVPGTVLKQFFNHMALKGGWPISKEIKYEIIDQKAKKITINGEAWDKSKTYYVGLSDYIANGGDGCRFFKKLPRKETGVLFRDAMIEYALESQAKGQKIEAEVEGRVIHQ